MILGVESSCDESALALLDPASGLCGEWVHSQLDLHREYGGVVPELASREHLETFPVLLEKVMDKVKGLSAKIEEIAVTCGPGLAPCLALGVSVSRALGIELAVPVRAINHLRGHAFSVFINLHEANPLEFFDSLQTYLPHLGLLVSGGNTLLFEIRSDLSIQVLAQTVDDAAGEALDKGAKLLGLDYPGGALLEKNALVATLLGAIFLGPLPRSPNSASVSLGSRPACAISLRKWKMLMWTDILLTFAPAIRRQWLTN